LAEPNDSATGGEGRALVLDCAIDRLDMAATVAACERIVERGEFAQQVSINAAKLVAMEDDPALRAAIESCALINADGQSVVWASRLLGDPLPERVAGIDLMLELFALAERRGYPIYILGAHQEVLETAVQRLRERFRGLSIAGYRDGYFAEGESAEVVDGIRASGAQMLFVAISSPRKERWLDSYGPQLGVSFAMGVGGSIDVVAGLTRRAPESWQRLGLEWLYRLLQEPRRMLRRYLVSNLRFSLLVARAAAVRLVRRERPGEGSG
jgi:N-acetylglucosaminyldiphosphoundecaprenol N-acetyl-beta-D-mannosaminyltransferase